MRFPLVTHHPESSRFEAHLDDEFAGFLDYEVSGDVVTFTHTEVAPAFAGRGVASALAKAALEQLRVEGRQKVRPECPFIAAWIDKNPAYQHLLAD